MKAKNVNRKAQNNGIAGGDSVQKLSRSDSTTFHFSFVTFNLTSAIYAD